MLPLGIISLCCFSLGKSFLLRFNVPSWKMSLIDPTSQGWSTDQVGYCQQRWSNYLFNIFTEHLWSMELCIIISGRTEKKYSPWPTAQVHWWVWNDFGIHSGYLDIAKRWSDIQQRELSCPLLRTIFQADLVKFVLPQCPISEDTEFGVHQQKCYVSSPPFPSR